MPCLSVAQGSQNLLVLATSTGTEQSTKAEYVLVCKRDCKVFWCSCHFGIVANNYKEINKVLDFHAFSLKLKQ